MNTFQLYRSPETAVPAGRLRVSSLGIHEAMLPGMLRYGLSHRTRQLVAGPLDEIVKAIIRIQLGIKPLRKGNTHLAIASFRRLLIPYGSICPDQPVISAPPGDLKGVSLRFSRKGKRRADLIQRRIFSPDLLLQVSPHLREHILQLLSGIPSFRYGDGDLLLPVRSASRFPRFVPSSGRRFFRACIFSRSCIFSRFGFLSPAPSG